MRAVVSRDIGKMDVADGPDPRILEACDRREPGWVQAALVTS